MGMFDWVECEYPLPDREEWMGTFQTKCLEKDLDYFVITESGELRKRGETGLEGEMTPIEPKLVNFTGALYFYDFNTKDGWVEYLADFCDGRMRKVERVERRPNDTWLSKPSGT